MLQSRELSKVCPCVTLVWVARAGTWVAVRERKDGSGSSQFIIWVASIQLGDWSESHQYADWIIEANLRFCLIIVSSFEIVSISALAGNWQAAVVIVDWSRDDH